MARGAKDFGICKWYIIFWAQRGFRMNIPIHSEFRITTSGVPMRGSLTFAFAAWSFMCLRLDRLGKFHIYYSWWNSKQYYICRYPLTMEYHFYTSINLLRWLSRSLNFGGSCIALNYSNFCSRRAKSFWVFLLSEMQSTIAAMFVMAFMLAYIHVIPVVLGEYTRRRSE